MVTDFKIAQRVSKFRPARLRTPEEQRSIGKWPKILDSNASNLRGEIV